MADETIKRIKRGTTRMMILDGKDIGIKFDDRWLYQKVNFQLNQAHNLALIGDNGVGKTTMIRAMLGKIPLTTGEFKWYDDGQHKIAYVPQYRPDMQAFPLRIRDFVGLTFDQGLRPWLSKEEKNRLQHILAITNLTSIADQRIDRASGGERQRAYLAQALVQKPNVLILDEATANLDNVAKYGLMDVVAAYQENYQLTTIMVSHDIDIMQRYADEYLLLTKHGSEYGNIDQLDVAKLREGGENFV